MFKRNLPVHVAGLTAFLSLLLFGVCLVAAGYLYWQLASTGQSLTEDVGSRAAAAALETTVGNLADLIDKGNDQVDTLHQRIDGLLGDVRRLADKEEEIKAVGVLQRNYDAYTRLWQERQTAPREARAALTAQALDVLRQDLLPECRGLRAFNDQQVVKSEAEHRDSIRQMAWGLAAVGSLGSLMGLALGYRVARGLRHSLLQMSVSVRDAAGKLGQELPSVSLTTDGDLHHLREQMQGVVREIEQMVRKLQDREREVLRAEQLSAVGQLAAGAAHELRNPLTSIKMLVQAAREKADLRGLPPTHLSIIEHEIRRMERCLQVFLDFARPPRPECRLLDLATVVGQSFDLLGGRARKQGVRLVFNPPAEPVLVEADAGQLQQLVVNLALNALDVMPEGGTLEVALGPGPDGAVELRVCDTGPGIAPAMMPRLFEPFVSTKETGLGLGLVVSRRIAECHQGSLHASNRPSGGACFTLRLPKAPDLRAATVRERSGEPLANARGS
jgi:signal transduction histidine kinase